jgi:hypothetical protein
LYSVPDVAVPYRCLYSVPDGEQFVVRNMPKTI